MLSQTALLFLWSHAEASATTYTVRFCVEIALDLADEGVGDRWLTDGESKPARGLLASVKDGFDDSYPWSGHLYESGANVGCTPQIALTNAAGHTYDLRVSTSASILTNTLYVEDSTVPIIYFTVYPYVDYVPSGAATTYTQIAPTIDGAAQPAFNHVAIAAQALYLHDGQLAGDVLTIDEDGCCGWDEAAVYPEMHVSTAIRSKSRITQLLGHIVEYDADDDANGISGNAPDRDDLSATNNCDGSDETGDFGLLTKEWHSAAAAEGFAEFYTMLTWNYVTDYDCESARWYRSDWDLANGWNTAANDPYDCEGDPNGGTDYVTAKDWLEDLVNASDPMSCGGTLSNRSTEYDWARFWWDAATDGDTIDPVPVQDLWEIWDDADPYAWDPDGSTGANLLDDPPPRIGQAFIDNGYGDAWYAQDDNGQNH